MELAKLVSKRQLVKVEINDKEFVDQEYTIRDKNGKVTVLKPKGETVEFYTWDRMQLSEFMSMAQSEDDVSSEMENRMVAMVLDKAGNKIFDEDAALTKDLLAVLVNKLLETMGK